MAAKYAVGSINRWQRLSLSTLIGKNLLPIRFFSHGFTFFPFRVDSFQIGGI